MSLPGKRAYLQCCHCFGSESGSVSQSESIIVTDGCDFCTDGVAPVRYQLDVSTTSTNLCAQGYVGSYVLSLVQVGGSCFWKSAELPLNRSGSGVPCEEHAGCLSNGWRWQVSMQNILGGVNIRATSHAWNGSSCVAYINMTGLQDTAATVRNCLVGANLSGTIAGVPVTGVLTVIP